ncbi:MULTISPECIES: ABC transporter ATP-binding protein [Archaeoglobus]|jgi:putative ABC transport system ATP-binding protein|uniref:ABC transporter, ATP-binding protein n=3 Tax=Archaeoglobus fulgidus TaxID=2234 RepID=O28456_ARCFU|nr:MULTISPECIES: ABC transporter ATP-binding protein [Archaeoglobus]AAB89431.1 ABC transporter, ATP-binding protein [Archaeoglobus fulgidus DSM 4304]AIG98819.1 ABC-type antimicrobial peptide transport system, ATPase component [Archaeoglobus fulgidus DSM 8774]KUJ92475.1 MAG: ABC transporter, ATP-binding protein [Archaeoglobus fulgidus]KUK05531.1 MAG: ABC transporter, ATP-binding protein [Archaeoglobus fulgidus]MDI3496750.1 putative transport system ATP-binding protein [Archaeoglobus sp.]
MLRLEDVWKVYQMGKVEVSALRGINLEIERGEFMVVLGPSGCGKTTMLNIIGGIDRPTRGRVIFDGKDITNYNEDRLTMHRRNNVGFIFQFFNLIPTLTARENVEIAADLVESPRDVDEVLKMVGLADRAEHFPAELSGGEQQRVAIARALVKNPPIILADEPTGSLDFETGKAVLKVMREINRKEGITFVLVTHNSAIAAIADRVVYLRDGKVERVERNLHPADPDEIQW